jgi:hypothetical protein
LGFSGSIDAWACGLLFDVVNIDGLNLTSRIWDKIKNGAGWNTATACFGNVRQRKSNVIPRQKMR